MLRLVSAWVALATIAAAAVGAQELTAADEARFDAAVRDAFAFVFAMPSDTAGAAMGTWVLDTAATGRDTSHLAHWRIVITRLTDTGSGLKVSEMVGQSGTSPAQLAASAAAMQKLEAKISKAEADASVEILVTLNEPELFATKVSDDAQRTTPQIAGAALALRVKGDWVHLEDRELEVDYDRWSPGTLMVGFGAFSAIETRRGNPKESLATFIAKARAIPGRRIHTIAVTAQGNDEMIDRLEKETKWAALAALLN